MPINILIKIIVKTIINITKKMCVHRISIKITLMQNQMHFTIKILIEGKPNAKYLTRTNVFSV